MHFETTLQAVPIGDLEQLFAIGEDRGLQHPSWAGSHNGWEPFPSARNDRGEPEVNPSVVGFRGFAAVGRYGADSNVP